ncbi:Aluminum-activated malate transporter 2 [Forsythia ovata]|uniref:Aluminum-activated malate transporter 2 n=1 Tax=Forsythia ovata TaxID=205694 RepID=A0ABD1VFN7_9LAMI
MEMESENQEKVSFLVLGWLRVKCLPRKFISQVVEIAEHAKKIAKDDPRKVFHSLKVGLALTLVSLFYYFQPLYSNFGVSTMWAVMTVVVVFEFSVGATLGKGLNRGLATLVAGALGLGAHHLATITGKIGEPILIGIFVFLQAVASTFIRFFPRVKARYDYGMLIFILTFCFVSISGFRTNDLLDLAHKRLSTILIGASTCLIVSIFVCPVWAGDDLHMLVALNLKKLGNILEGFGDEFSNSSAAKESENDISLLVGMNSILDSKNKEETLANFASWEPGHGQFMYRHPWKQYLKIGNLTRQCACRVEALNGYLNPKTQASKETNGMIEEAFSNMSSESGIALKELALAIETMTIPSCPNRHITNLKMASKNLKSLLKSDICENTNLLQIIPVAAIASLLIETAICVENFAEAVNELASLANFKQQDSNGSHVISINEPTLEGDSGQNLTL